MLSIFKILSYELEYKKLQGYDKLPKKELKKLKILQAIPMYLGQGNKMVSQSKLQLILSDIEKKLDDSEHITRYLASILIFLGLFGTFWGLSKTIGNVASIIDNLGLEQDAAASFAKLKDSLKIPLEGMGIAFGCSLFGLSGSLLLGFVNMNQRNVGNKLFVKAEEWLSKQSVSFAAVESESSYHGQVFSMGLLEKTIETIYAFQHQMRDMNENKISLYAMQKEISQRLAELSSALVQHQDMVHSLGRNQLELQNAVSIFASHFSDKLSGELISRLAAIDTSINLMIQSSVSNRDFIVNNLGPDIKMVSKTLSSLIRD